MRNYLPSSPVKNPCHQRKCTFSDLYSCFNEIQQSDEIKSDTVF